MLYLLYGDDTFSVQEALSSLKDEIRPEELRDVNISVLDGTDARFEEMAALCDTVPFLAEKRLVIVQGVLSQYEPRSPRASGTGRGSGGDGWDGLQAYVATMPQSTDLVLVDGRLTGANPLLKKLRTLGKLQTFPLPTGNELRRWIRNRAADKGIEIEPRAVEALADTIGGDLRTIDTELEKLSLYCRGRTVGYEDVEALVTYARDASIFAAVDAVVEGKAENALRLVHRLLDAGTSPAHVLSMLARQVRLLLLAKEHKSRGLNQPEIGSRLRLSGFPLRKTMEQETLFTADQLCQVYHRLLETDVSIKTGASDEQMALELLIADLAIDSQSRGAPRRRRRS